MLTLSVPQPSLAARENGYTYSIFDAHCLPDLEALEKLIQRAWSQDYDDKAVIAFDRHYLRWLLQGDRWFGIQVADSEGRLVGCEVALEREILWQGHRLRGYYVTLLSVAPCQRGRGLAQGILRHLTTTALERYGADVLVSSFDAGAAGQPTVKKAIVGARGRLDLRVSPPMALWACVPDLREMDRYEPLKGLARLALVPGIRSLLGFPAQGKAPRADILPVGLDELSARGPRYGFRFAPTEALADMYRPHSDGTSGTLQFRYSAREKVTISWHVMTLRKAGMPDRPLGAIQFVVPEGACECSVVGALRHVNRLLLQQGCIATTIQNTGVVTPGVLWRAGFRPTARKIHFAVRGPEATLARFTRFPAPLGVDLL